MSILSATYRFLKHISPSPGWGRDKGWGHLSFLEHISPSPGWGRGRGGAVAFLFLLLLSACSSTNPEEGDYTRMPIILAIPVNQGVSTRAAGDPGTYEKFVLPKHLYLYLVSTNNNGTEVIHTPEGMDATNGYNLDATKWTKTVITTGDFQTTGDSIYRYTDQININLLNSGSRKTGVVYAAMSSEPITVTMGAGTSTDQIKNATFVLPSSVTDANWGEALKNLYSTPYNLTKKSDANTYYGTVSDYTSNSPHVEMVLYHTAAKLDLNWNVASSIQSTTNVKTIALTGLSRGGYLFRPMENTTSASTTYTHTITTDVGNQWYGRAETYVIPFGSDLNSYTLNMTIKNGVNSGTTTTSQSIQIGNAGKTAVFTPWMLGKVNITKTW